MTYYDVRGSCTKRGKIRRQTFIYKIERNLRQYQISFLKRNNTIRSQWHRRNIINQNDGIEVRPAFSSNAWNLILIDSTASWRRLWFGNCPNLRRTRNRSRCLTNGPVDHFSSMLFPHFLHAFPAHFPCIFHASMHCPYLFHTSPHLLHAFASPTFPNFSNSSTKCKKFANHDVQLEILLRLLWPNFAPMPRRLRFEKA